MALDLARQEMNLVLAARDGNALEELARQIGDRGASVLVHPTDVTDESQCRTLITRTIERFKRLDYLVLNAGLGMWVRFDQVTDLSIFRRLMDVNYMGVVNCIHPALPYLKEACGTVVTISSAQALIGISKHTGYSATKHALRGFLEALEFEMGGQIRFLTVMPGWVSGTKLRANALGAAGAPLGASRLRHTDEAVSLEECSTRIVRAMQEGSSAVYIPWKIRAIPWLKLLVPGWLRARIKRSMAQQEK